MTEKQRELLKLIIRDHTKRTTASVDQARESLVEEGILNEHGQLTPGYGGTEVA